MFNSHGAGDARKVITTKYSTKSQHILNVYVFNKRNRSEAREKRCVCIVVRTITLKKMSQKFLMGILGIKFREWKFHEIIFERLRTRM